MRILEIKKGKKLKSGNENSGNQKMLKPGDLNQEVWV